MMRTQLIFPVQRDDHSQGPLDAQVTLVEYADFECPYSYLSAEISIQLLGRFRNEIRYVFRHFPLLEIHDCSVFAAEASEAAAVQGGFWKMHSLLFLNQEALDPESMIYYAGQAGLNLERFNRDLQYGGLLERVERDLKSGRKSGVTSTPTFFINDCLYQGSYDFESLSYAIQGAFDKMRSYSSNTNL